MSGAFLLWGKWILIMQLQDILYSQGFGTRRICAGLVQQGWVRVRKITHDASQFVECLDATAEFEPTELCLSVRGVEWPYKERAYIMLNKPSGTECSQKPSAYPSIYTLLAAPLRQRPVKGMVQGVHAIGRLDQDTTGMLLLSDDGQFIHRMSSPKKHVPKIYEVTVKHDVTPLQVEQLLAGVLLDDSPKPVRAAECVCSGERNLSLTLTEGKYHQVKRMIAAVGNRVVGLHRSRIGNLGLPSDLPAGQWRWLDGQDLEKLQMAPIPA